MPIKQIMINTDSEFDIGGVVRKSLPNKRLMINTTKTPNELAFYVSKM